ncbi:GH92 family glycosyl hydrolase [Bifidobacterium aquikefiri]|uniref:GH92 family glycosyl hydrolase n=1 Tax=Bifidobacterium aquikefiri TaxID=1653207 RepID=UPI0039EABFBF
MALNSSIQGPTDAPTSRPLTGLESVENIPYQIERRGEAIQRTRVEYPKHTIGPNDILQYAVFPVFNDDAEDGFGFEATAVAIDVQCDDGSWLSELGAHDEAGFSIAPRAQYESHVLSVNQWNLKTVDLSQAMGKTIVEIDIVSWHSAESHTSLLPHGWFSDIAIATKPKPSENLVELIDIRRGTNSSLSYSRGNCAPAVTVPHGFNFGIPITDADDISWTYKYHVNNHSDNTTPLQALAISHTATNWGSERNVLHIMPTADVEKGAFGRKERELSFRHRDEEARPYHYCVSLPHHIDAEMTSTDHVVAMRFTLPETGGLILDQYDSHGSLVFNKDNPTFQISGYNDSKFGDNPSAPRMFFAISCNHPITSVHEGAIPERSNVSAAISFKGIGPVVIRIATSFISLEQAVHSLELEMPPEVTFDDVVMRSKHLWEEKLGLVNISGASLERRVSFASGMYRMFMYPNNAAENAGTVEWPHWVYADVSDPRDWRHGNDRTGCEVRQGRSYVNNGFWDTYRTIWPAYCLFEPDAAAQLLDGFVDHYRASGWIDRWCAPGPTGGMVGSSADIVIANAMISGVDLIDAESAYDAALRDATTISHRSQVGRFDNDHAIFRGYVSTATEEGLSWSLEDCLNDFGIAQASRWMLDHTDEHDPRRGEYAANSVYFRNRAMAYAQMFNSDVDFFMGRTESGDFRSSSQNFDPRVWGGDYTETNAWGMAFSVPFDGEGLAALYGGRDGLEKKLDAYFSTPETAHFVGTYNRVIHEMLEARDIRMGMFGLSNQPAHHIAYMYAFTGAPYKTQAIVRDSLRRLFLGSSIGQGYPGDEDNGEMSAWYVFSSIGLYPLTPASGEMLITSPSMPQSTIAFPNGVKTTILAHDWTEDNVYIQDVRVNGKTWDSLSIPITLIRKGITIEIDLGPEPGDWGTTKNSAAYSLTEHGKMPVAVKDMTRPEDAMDRALLSSEGSVWSDSSSLGYAPQPNAALLFDDSFDAGLKLCPSDCVSYEFDNRRSIALYTVSLGESSVSLQKAQPDGPSEGGVRTSFGWAIEVSDDGSSWTTIDEQHSPAYPWDEQTCAFLISEPKAARFARFRVVGEHELDVRQLEYFEG